MEMDTLNMRLGLKKTNFTIVNNAIDILVFDKILENNKIEKKTDLITFVGRIDPRKNQLKFLEAMENTDYRIRFIGNLSPNFQSYYKHLRQMALKRGNVEFISHISQEELFKHMVEAKVNVLTSWIETPGLVSIEAAFAGCNLVVSDKGSVRDYFRDYAFYCSPDDTEDIKRQTVRAMESDFDEDLRLLVSKEYSWEKASEQTLEGYKRVLNI
jgi:glycosyltransferase involved in cell wall biosynthesis